MPFTAGVNVCVCVEPSNGYVEDVDHGTIVSAKAKAEYEVARAHLGETKLHIETQLFTLDVGESRVRKFYHKGYFVEVTWSHNDNGYDCTPVVYTRSGKPL